MLDARKIKNDFPVFKTHPELVFLDNASTTQKPDVVLHAMESFYKESNANIHRGVYPLAVDADRIYEHGRKVVANFIGALPEQIVFTKNATEGANMAAFGIGEAYVQAGDNVVVTELEHHANYLPWQEMSKRKGAEFRVCPLTDILNGVIPDNLIDENTKVVAVTQMSNVIGAQPDILNIVKKAKEVGAIVVLDASQGAAHMPLDVKALDVDATFFTGHKIFGPMGIGVLYLNDTLASDIPPMLTGGGMIKELPDNWLDSPSKFEAGTPNVAAVAGLSAAINFFAGIGINEILQHEKELVSDCKDRLTSIPQVKILGNGSIIAQSGIVSFELEGIHPHDIASLLAEENICIRAGHHCAKPLLKSMGVTSVSRASFSIYNSLDDVQALVNGIKKALNVFK